VALQGTIDTFDLTEVIRMLSDGEKTGRLGLSGDRGSGSLWFAGGRLVASETDTAEPTPDHAAVLFQLLRFEDGSFVFDHGDESPDLGEAADVGPVLDEVQHRLEEWSEIEAVVPSLQHRVELQTDLSRSDVVIDQAGWQAVVAISGGLTVGALGRHLQLDELAVSRTVKSLVELGLVEVGGEEQEPSPDGSEPADADDTDFAPRWLAEEPVAASSEGPIEDTTARDQLDALASGFGLTDDPSGADSVPVESPPAAPPPLEVDEPLELGDPAPLPGAVEEGAGSFPIEEAEAAGEARSPLFAHDPDTAPPPVDPSGPLRPPGEAAEVARQLANLSPEAARAVAAAARATTEEEREEALALVAEDGDEPLDPDLLRSFLSSVRQ
jgi:DNA-binding transcriptional ArsR family regulator